MCLELCLGSKHDFYSVGSVMSLKIQRSEVNESEAHLNYNYIIQIRNK